ncbi:MAG: bifunctional 3-(3-hydroxy-phenyl)propionate/3-hydroxycinnamic acid hydroxylase [Solirubrobacterales bacterium]
MAYSCDVAIVGFGPAGEALASLLGRGGHRIVVFEKFPHPYGLPRMSTLDGEIARLLQHAGDRERALSSAIPQLEVELWGAQHQRIGSLDWRYKRAGHPSHLSVNQPDIEAAMEIKIAECPSVDVRWGREVTSFEPLVGGGYKITATSPGIDGGDPSEESVTARFLVGMDGASSMVRQRLGIDLEVVHQHQDRWVLTDFDVIGELPNGLDHRIYTDMDCEQPYFYGPNGKGRCRTDVRLLPGDADDIADDHDAAYEFLERRVGVPRSEVKVTRRVLYRFRSQIAKQLRVGNAFIGGDAAHAMPPFLGQGACTAMRDSAGLAWKLDLVLSGKADEALLDTYESERLEHSGQFVHGSFGTLSLVTVSDPEEAAMRDTFVQDQGAVEFHPDPIMDGVIRRSADGTPASDAGELAPQGQVSVDGSSPQLLDDVVGYGFQLLFREPVIEALGDQRRQRLAELGFLFIAVDCKDAGAQNVEDADGTYAEFFGTRGATALISRPDFYLFGIANGVHDTLALVDDLLAQIPAPSPAVIPAVAS